MALGGAGDCDGWGWENEEVGIEAHCARAEGRVSIEIPRMAFASTADDASDIVASLAAEDNAA
jgi:hypothetical protein